MKAVIAICTWNRGDSLRRTLESIARLAVPSSMFSVLVVNNNSTDCTSDVIAEFVDRMPIVEAIERKQGLSHARNCALDSSDGADLLIYTDDDVVVQPEWLNAYCDAYQKYPDAGFFGGPIEAGFCSKVPSWLLRNLHKLAGSYGMIDLGGDLRVMSTQECRCAPHGGNMAFSKRYTDGLRFDPKLGRVSTDMLMGEETSFITEMVGRGLAGVWVPGARLTHSVPDEHVSYDYVWKRFEGGGISVARGDGYTPGPRWWGAPRYCWKQYVLSRMKMLLHCPVRSDAWFEAFSQTAYLHGYISEQRRMNLLVGGK